MKNNSKYRCLPVALFVWLILVLPIQSRAQTAELGAKLAPALVQVRAHDAGGKALRPGRSFERTCMFSRQFARRWVR